VNTDRLWAAFSGLVILSLMGLMGYFGFGRPILSMIAARDWTPTTCEIVRSSVNRSGTRNDPSFKADVAYRYVVGGHSYIGYRDRFTAISTNMRSRVNRRMAHVPPGSKIPCWYDPARPTEAVLDRSPSTDLIWIVFPLGFGAAGAAIIGYAIFGFSSPTVTVKPSTAVATNNRFNTGGRIVVGIMLFMMFGLAAGLGIMAVADWRSGHELGIPVIGAFILAAAGVRTIQVIVKAQRS
jgi:hypothetical protein